MRLSKNIKVISKTQQGDYSCALKPKRRSTYLSNIIFLAKWIRVYYAIKVSGFHFVENLSNYTIHDKTKAKVVHEFFAVIDVIIGQRDKGRKTQPRTYVIYYYLLLYQMLQFKKHFEVV